MKNKAKKETIETALQIEKLKQMAEKEIDESNPDDLVDIEDVKINTELPQQERIADFLRQIKNPYCYKSNGIIIKIGFAGKKKLEDCLKEAMLLEEPEVKNSPN